MGLLGMVPAVLSLLSRYSTTVPSHAPPRSGAEACALGAGVENDEAAAAEAAPR